MRAPFRRKNRNVAGPARRYDHPMPDAITDRLVRLCRHLSDHPEASLDLGAMGELIGLSPGHLQRRFRALVGVSPHQFQAAQRLHLFKTGLRAGLPVTRALHEAGYSSPSRMHASAQRDMGMRPGEYRRGGDALHITHAVRATPLGPMMIAASERGLCFLQFANRAEALEPMLAAELPRAELHPMPEAGAPALDAWMEPLLAHLDGRPAQLGLPLDLQGTAFQQTVWRYLQQIPSGQTRSYAQVAAALGKPGAARAVARACASNRVAVLIPCHRVIRGDGAAGGYRWGLPRKRALLEAEARWGAQPNARASTRATARPSTTPSL